MKNNQIKQVTEALVDLKQDSTVPKNIKVKIEKVINILNEESGLFLRINKALNELDDISSDNNIQSYTRTQIWNVVSLLESI
ncbi:hypothetical protein GF327_00530 [Candidatus Woesearchaeota archaeon]|nr:hypothetical protein [Candidatus Woesearchaeota archaeon]